MHCPLIEVLIGALIESLEKWRAPSKLFTSLCLASTLSLSVSVSVSLSLSLSVSALQACQPLDVVVAAVAVVDLINDSVR